MKMRHSTEPRFKKYVKGYGFLSFALKFADKYGKKLMDTATKTGIDVNVNRLFVLLFQRIIGENNAAKGHRDSFSDYYIPKVEIKEFNVLIHRKSLFDLPVKNEEEAYEKIIDMSNSNDCRTGNLLDFAYLKIIADSWQLI